MTRTTASTIQRHQAKDRAGAALPARSAIACRPYAALLCSGAFLFPTMHGARAQPQCQIVCTYSDHGGKPTFAVTTCHLGIKAVNCADLTQSLAGRFGIIGCTGELVAACKPGKVPHPQDGLYSPDKSRRRNSSSAG
jgi:hypothetical protein